MCTSLSYQTIQGTNFLARTMDFDFELEGVPTVILRNQSFPLELGGEMENRYGYVGTVRKLNTYFFADGINERGLAIAELYFPNEAEYVKQPIDNKVNLAPHEFMTWSLGQFGSLEELKSRIDEVAIALLKTSYWVMFYRCILS